MLLTLTLFSLFEQPSSKIKYFVICTGIWWNKIDCVLLHSWRENNFLGFYSKWLLWQPFTAFGGFIFDSTDANNPCSFTKPDLILKQAYLVGFCFVLFNKLKFWQLVLVFSALYRLYLEINPVNKLSIVTWQTFKC